MEMVTTAITYFIPTSMKRIKAVSLEALASFRSEAPLVCGDSQYLKPLTPRKYLHYRPM